MTADACFASICFFALAADAPRFFGFAEFLTALALMVIAWTIADVRYRFRVRVALIPLQGFTFGVIAIVGLLTLLTDLWRAQQWLVPVGSIFTPASWQAFLGGSFLVTFLVWTWFAFIRPPIFGRLNAKRFSKVVYRHVITGSPTELAVIADELARSMKALVRFAPHKQELQQPPDGAGPPPQPPKVAMYANDLLLLIADRRFCRAIVG